MGFKGLSRDEFLFLFCFPRRSGAKAGNLYNNTHSITLPPPPLLLLLLYFVFCVCEHVASVLRHIEGGTKGGGGIGGDEESVGTKIPQRLAALCCFIHSVH